jgi:hypothetical protein
VFLKTSGIAIFIAGSSSATHTFYDFNYHAFHLNALLQMVNHTY